MERKKADKNLNYKQITSWCTTSESNARYAILILFHVFLLFAFFSSLFATLCGYIEKSFLAFLARLQCESR